MCTLKGNFAVCELFLSRTNKHIVSKNRKLDVGTLEKTDKIENSLTRLVKGKEVCTHVRNEKEYDLWSFRYWKYNKVFWIPMPVSEKKTGSTYILRNVIYKTHVGKITIKKFE